MAKKAPAPKKRASKQAAPREGAAVFSSKADFYEGSPIYGGGEPSGPPTVVGGSPGTYSLGRPANASDPTLALVTDPTPSTLWSSWVFIEAGPSTDGFPASYLYWQNYWTPIAPIKASVVALNASGWVPPAAFGPNDYYPCQSAGVTKGYASWDGTKWVSRPSPAFPGLGTPPVLDEVTPSTWSMATGPVVVTLTGSGFTPESLVQDNFSVFGTTTYVSPTELTWATGAAAGQVKHVSVYNPDKQVTIERDLTITA